MSNSSTIWVDMTDLSSWKGHFTGIQRVVYNIGKGYHDNNEAKYFVFDPQKEHFYEYDFSALRSLVESQLNEGNEHGLSFISRKERLVNLAKRSYNRMPEPIKKVATPQRLKRVAKKGYNQYQRATRAKSRAIELFKYSSDKPIQFNSGDTVLILGNSWDRPNFLPVISRIKEQSDIKVVQVIYDLIPIFQPQAFNEDLFNTYTKNMFEVVNVSDGLMAISESSKFDTQRFCNELGIKEPSIQVIRLGDDIPFSEQPKAPREVSSEDTFILCVGTIEARKNHTLLYYAWKEGIRRGIKMPRLLIVGRRGWYTGDIIHTIKSDPQMVDHVTILNNVSDDELAWLYENCAFTVYPSYYEGWGLPIAESLAMGRVCLTSNVSSMPEVGGDLCLYHSPFDSGECLEGIVKLLDPSARKEMEQKIRETYKPVAWYSTYEQCRDFVRSL